MPLTQSELSKKLTEVKDRARCRIRRTVHPRGQGPAHREGRPPAERPDPAPLPTSPMMRSPSARNGATPYATPWPAENSRPRTVTGSAKGAPRFNQTDTTRARFAGDCASLAPYSTGRTSP